MFEGNSVERHGGEDGEARDAGSRSLDAAVEPLVRHHESRCPSQKPEAGEPHAAGLELLLEQVEGERGDERAAGESQRRRDQHRASAVILGGGLILVG
jgi:hypothetical protein